MKQNRNVELAATQALLDRGVGFQIPAPFLFRLFGKKTITISVKRLRLGTLLHISELIPTEALEEVDRLKARTPIVKSMKGETVSLQLSYIVEHHKAVCRAVACGLLNSKWKIRLLSRWLGRYLRRHCTTDQLQELVLWIFAYGRADSFMNTTKLLRMMKMTEPRNLGQTMERS